MSTVWITYAWADNAHGDIDFIAQELVAAGVDVKLDRWNISAGGRLWEQIQAFISDEQHTDGWLFVATHTSLESEACREEFAYALNRALKSRGEEFPVLALFPGPVDDDLIPPAIQVRLHVSMSDADWKERVIAALDRRAPSVVRQPVEPYALIVHENHPSGRIIVEVRPRAGQWAPVFAGVPSSEKEGTNPWIFVEPAGMITGTGMVMGPREGLSSDGEWWMLQLGQRATPTESLYVWLDLLPSALIFGVGGGQPQYRVELGRTHLKASP